MSYKPVDRQILITTEAPSTNPPNGIVYQWVDNDGFLHQLDSNGNNQRYVNLEELNQKVSTSDIVNDLNSTDTDKPLSANQGKLLQDNKEDADSTILKEGDVEDSLNSTSTTKPLSANQGKILNDDKEDADSTILKEGDVEDSLNSTSTTKPLSANQGKILQDGKEDADSTILKEGDVEDNLNSTSTNKPLSANQGKQLNDDKASLSALGTMSEQDSDDVDISGGEIDGTPIGLNSDSSGKFSEISTGHTLYRQVRDSGNFSNGSSLEFEFQISRDRNNPIFIEAIFNLQTGSSVDYNHVNIYVAVDGGIVQQNTSVIAQSSSNLPIEISHVSGGTYKITATNNVGSTLYYPSLFLRIFNSRDRFHDSMF